MVESNNNVIGFIASTVETMRDEIATVRDQTATKNDLVGLSNRLDSSTTPIRGDIEQVYLRVDAIGHAVPPELSRSKEN